MNVTTKAMIMGYKLASEVLKSGRSISAKLEACFREHDTEKARSIADPAKMDTAFDMVVNGAEAKIEAEEKRNWYYWAKPRGRKSSPEFGAEKAFKEFYRGDTLTIDEKQVVLGALSMMIEEELNELKKERDTIRM